MNMLSLSSEGANKKYLGLPIYIGRSKTKAFQYPKDHIWKSLLVSSY